MIDLRSKIGPVHAGKSKFSVKANHVELNMHRLMDIIQFSFSSGCFTTLGKCYRQVQGTSIGNQVSPILSSLSIVAYERAWLHTHETLLSRLPANFLCCVMWTTVQFSVMKIYCSVLDYSNWLVLTSTRQFNWKMKNATSFLGFASMLRVEKCAT